MTGLQIAKNKLPLAVCVQGYDPGASANRLRFVGLLDPGQGQSFTITEPTARIVLASSGAIVCEFPMTEDTDPVTKTIDLQAITAPFKIPPPPQSSASHPIPPDSTPWLVGVGDWSKGSTSGSMRVVITREQFWRKSQESFSLPPKSFVMKTLNQTTGATKSSSTAAQMQGEIGVNLTAGWGPFSAAVSASLSMTSQRTDTVTIRETSSREVSQFISNDTDQSTVVCFWQLMDRIRITKAGNSGTPSVYQEHCARAVDTGMAPLIPVSFNPAEALERNVGGA